jgi:hypothetical protein
MENKKLLNVSELEANLTLDERSVGNFVGISDQFDKNWKLAIYLGKKEPHIILLFISN